MGIYFCISYWQTNTYTRIVQRPVQRLDSTRWDFSGFNSWQRIEVSKYWPFQFESWFLRLEYIQRNQADRQRSFAKTHRWDVAKLVLSSFWTLRPIDFTYHKISHVVWIWILIICISQLINWCKTKSYDLGKRTHRQIIYEYNIIQRNMI